MIDIAAKRPGKLHGEEKRQCSAINPSPMVGMSELAMPAVVAGKNKATQEHEPSPREITMTSRERIASSNCLQARGPAPPSQGSGDRTGQPFSRSEARSPPPFRARCIVRTASG